MAKESNAGEKPATNNAEPVIGHRFIQVGKHTKSYLIEFKVFLLRPDGKTVRVFGEGVFEEQDLYCLATTLSELARESVSGGWFWIDEKENVWAV
jgi:hypothetical protein